MPSATSALNWMVNSRSLHAHVYVSKTDQMAIEHPTTRVKGKGKGKVKGQGEGQIRS